MQYTTLLWPILIISTALIVVIQILRWILRPKAVEYYSRDLAISSSGHHFVSIFEHSLGLYCNSCENGMQSGMRCDFCGILVDSAACLESLAVSFPCKIAVTPRNGQILHHWVPGNLPPTSICSICEEECGDGVGLVDFRCAFCQCTVHTRCKQGMSDLCTMGINCDFIIPPTCVIARKVGSRRYKQLVVEKISEPSAVRFTSWTPLFVIVNPKSGGAEGFATLRAFRQFLHPVQVINIQQVGLGTALRWINSNSNISCRILIAGGDGTVSLALDAINELQRKVPAAILPLGTGNDLSRVLGWGSDHEGPINFSELCSKLRNAETVKLDRWAIEVIHRRRLGVRAKNRRFRMVNYISVGVDACVTYGMQSTRDSIRRIVSSRFLNKFLFFTYGTKNSSSAQDVLEHACANLEQKLELIVDGSIIPLPQIEGLTIINIPCWGAGVRPWINTIYMPQSFNDHKFEVFGVRSSFHIAQMQIGVSQGIPLAQGNTLKLRIFGATIPMQCDGEAWLQTPGLVQITHQDQVLMLINKTDEEMSHGSRFF